MDQIMTRSDQPALSIVAQLAAHSLCKRMRQRWAGGISAEKHCAALDEFLEASFNLVKRIIHDMFIIIARNHNGNCRDKKGSPEFPVVKPSAIDQGDCQCPISKKMGSPGRRELFKCLFMGRGVTALRMAS